MQESQIESQTHFLERTIELQDLILITKTYQSMICICISLQRGIKAIFRNLPTLIFAISEDYNKETALQSNNSTAKKLKKLTR